MIKHKKLRAISKCKTDVFVCSVSVRDMARELMTLRSLCDEVYEVVGCLTASCLDDFFDMTEVSNVLDNLAAAGNGRALPHKELLPFHVKVS